MKKLVVLTLLVLPLLLLSACSKSGEGTDAATAPDTAASGSQTLDTAKLQSAFSTAPEADKAEVQNAVTAVKSGKYADALASLKKVASSTNLTPEQKSAVQEFMGQVQAKVTGFGEKMTSGASDAAKQAGQDASKAAGDLQKSLPK